MKTIITFKITEVADLYRVETNEITRFINEEWIQPIDPDNLLLDEDDIARLQLILDLKNQFGVNDESVPIILHLIDQLNCFKAT